MVNRHEIVRSCSNLLCSLLCSYSSSALHHCRGHASYNHVIIGEHHPQHFSLILYINPASYLPTTHTYARCIRELELQLQASLASTHNGSFLWRIPEVARGEGTLYIEERITSIYNPPFYTRRHSHTLGHMHTHAHTSTQCHTVFLSPAMATSLMCIRAYLNGDGIG